MSTQEKKDYLCQYKLLDCKIQCRTEELGVWRKRRAELEQRHTSMAEPEFVHTCERIAQLEQLINREIDELIDLKLEIERCIRTLPDGKYRFVLECRYIAQCTWEQIGDMMHYDWRHAHRIHKKAIELLQLSSGQQKRAAAAAIRPKCV